MKRLFVFPLIVFTAMSLLAGCAWQVGGDKKYERSEPTIGQQLIDLQKARNAGALSEGEYLGQKARILNHP
jgi:hypothetical protein